jgi:hypothetical protein
MGEVGRALEVLEQRRVEQIAFVGEVQQHGAGRDAGFSRDRSDVRALEAALLEVGARGVEDARARRVALLDARALRLAPRCGGSPRSARWLLDERVH